MPYALKLNRKFVFWLAFWVFIAPGIPFILGSMGFFAYTFFPIKYKYLDLNLYDGEQSKAVIIAHGLRDQAHTWATPLAKIIRQKDTLTDTYALDWNPYSQNTFRCSVDGKRIGHKIAQALLQNKALSEVELIAHSCGAFVILGVCEGLKKIRPDIHIKARYLDPVSVYGGFFWNYGLAHFGRCADEAKAYIDTGDGVPGSNQVLPHMPTIDTTRARLLSKFKGNPHNWPIHYYTQHRLNATQ